MVKTQRLAKENLFCDLKNDEQALIILIDDDNCDIMKNLLSFIYKDRICIYYAEGLPINIEENLEDFKQFKHIFFREDSDKFFIKQYPKLIVAFPTENNLSSLLDNWVCSVTEQRIIYFIGQNKENSLDDIMFLISEKFENLDEFNAYDVRIENVPESDQNSTFLLVYKEKYALKIKEFLNSQLNGCGDLE